MTDKTNLKIAVSRAPARAREEIGGNSIAGDQLKAIVERIEKVDEEIGGLNSDKRDIFAEAKANGFDTKILKRVVGIRRKDHAERKEEEAILDLYLAALGMD